MKQLELMGVDEKLITKSWNETLENIIKYFKNDIYDDVSVGPRLDCIFTLINEIMIQTYNPENPTSYWTEEDCMLFIDALSTHFVKELYG